MIILKLGEEGAAVIILVFGNKETMGLTSIYIMIILDVDDECAAGFASGPLGHEKQKDPPLWLLETKEGLGGRVAGLLRSIEADFI